MAGSRPGNIIAGAWAAMLSVGRDGYKENAKIILSACVGMKKAIREEIPEL
jgi:sphinganine-1-phosphate aldolase